MIALITNLQCMTQSVVKFIHNYCLGLARELLKNQNCKIFEDTGVISYESQKSNNKTEKI